MGAPSASLGTPAARTGRNRSRRSRRVTHPLDHLHTGAGGLGKGGLSRRSRRARATNPLRKRGAPPHTPSRQPDALVPVKRQASLWRAELVR